MPLHVDARWIEQLESGLEHTDDFEGLIAETDDLADHAGVGAKAPLPELVAQDGARRVLGRRWTVCLHTIGLGGGGVPSASTKSEPIAMRAPSTRNRFGVAPPVVTGSASAWPGVTNTWRPVTSAARPENCVDVVRKS